MLRNVEPLVAQGEMRATDYAYLEDRVMLQLTGRQRCYGTQMECHNNHLRTAPLVDAANVDTLRARVGLGPVAAHQAQMLAHGGGCGE